MAVIKGICVNGYAPFFCRFQADFWLKGEWIEPFEWIGMFRFRHMAS